MRKLIVGALLALFLTACAVPNGGGSSGADSKPAKNEASEPIDGPAGVVDSHRGNHLVIVPFDPDDGGPTEVAANRAQRKACPPGSRFPDCLP